MKKLPKPNPPSADSPLAAGQHYEITRSADLAIQKRLLSEPLQRQREFLIGLDVQYFVSKEEDGQETSYAMPFGKVVSTLEETQTGKTSLSPEFLDKLYARVDDYVRENVQLPYLVISVILQVRTNRVLHSLSCCCKTIGSTYQGYPVICNRRQNPCPRGSKRNACLDSRKKAWICNHNNC